MRAGRTCGCWPTRSYRVVVPLFWAPMTRKSGSGRRVALSRRGRRRTASSLGASLAHGETDDPVAACTGASQGPTDEGGTDESGTNKASQLEARPTPDLAFGQFCPELTLRQSPTAESVRIGREGS